MPTYIQNSKVNLYADDTAISVHGIDSVEIETKLNESLVQVSQWFAINKLSLNHKNSKFMIFSSRSKHFDLETINIGPPQQRLEGVPTFKYLGVKLDPHLTFENHVAYIRGKTIGKLKMLGRVRRVMDQETCANLYRSLVLPLFDYCDVVYDGLRQIDCEILQKLQNAACRIILKSDSRCHIEDLHSDLNLEILQSRRWRHSAHEMYKIYHELAPISLQNMFVLPRNRHDRTTCFSESANYVVPRCKLEQTKRSFRVRGVYIWSQVPIHLKVCLELQLFKQELYSERIF